MTTFEVVAHRGAGERTFPENSLAAYRRALELGADAIELDVRLSKDGEPLIYHWVYLHERTTGVGPIFGLTAAEIREVWVTDNLGNAFCPVPTLSEVLSEFGGRIGLEIELKGPEPEAASVVSSLLNDFRNAWPLIEVTSYEPLLLREIQQRCPGLPTDFLIPLSEVWMGLDVVAYTAVHRARQANARAVHLHPTQLTSDVVQLVRSQGLEVHAWDVNDEEALRIARELDVPRICTDRLVDALAFRNSV
jgi:glycerophosphoryl diester phosphodiesterase